MNRFGLLLLSMRSDAVSRVLWPSSRICLALRHGRVDSTATFGTARCSWPRFYINRLGLPQHNPAPLNPRLVLFSWRHDIREVIMQKRKVRHLLYLYIPTKSPNIINRTYCCSSIEGALEITKCMHNLRRVKAEAPYH